MSLSRTKIARTAWVVLSVLSFVVYVLRIPHRYSGMEPTLTNSYFYLWELPMILVWIGLGALILWRVGTNEGVWWPFAIAAMLSLYGTTFMQDPRTQLALPLPLALLAGVLHQAGGWGIFAFCFYFPDGKPVPQRLAQVLLPFWAIMAAPAFLAPNSPLSFLTWPPAIGSTLVLGLMAVNVGALVYRYRRYRRVSDEVLRQQTKWVVFGIVVAALVNMVVQGAHISLWNRPTLILVLDVINHVTHSLIPIAIAFAILRFRLWSIDRIISRTLVYAVLTGLIALSYTLAVGWFGLSMQEQSTLGVSLIGTALVAALFVPLRDWLQLAVNRLLYGERDTPYTVITRLGDRLESTMAPADVLPVILQTVTESLRLPYAAVALRDEDDYVIAASSGMPRDGTVVLPLIHQMEEVGRLIVGLRRDEEEFSPVDMELLEGLARQAGHSIHTIRLTAALQRSREQAVTAREEERRRIRNDLHDGVGPAMASHLMKLGVARTLVSSQPEQAEQLLLALDKDLRGTLAEVRRVVYNLRPPMLDDLGLVGAIHRTAGEFRQGGLQVEVEAPEPMPALPAAVEVAAFRIAQEALNNVARHARASRCKLAFATLDGVPGTGLGRRLLLSISDDGIGIAPQRSAGVGLSSMRERTAELGGGFLVEAAAGGGTRITAWLPLPGRHVGRTEEVAEV